MDKLEEIWLDHRNKIIMALVLVVGGIVFLMSRPKQSQFSSADVISSSESSSALVNSASNQSKKVCVDVKGAVKKPGIYKLSRNARVNEALKAAGGETGDADINQVNLAKQLTDAQVIYIPRHGEKASGSFAENVQSSPNGEMTGPEQEIININTATKEQLCKITGIGDKKADLIIRYRQEHGNFNSIDDLKNINGFGEKTIAKLKPSLAV